MPKRSFFVKDSELDDYQVKVINRRADNSFIVRGCAGSGKSILALWKAKQIQSEKKGTYQVIVYTKALMQYMADGIKQIGLDPKYVDYHWNWVNRKGAPEADYIIVDEAQDFTEEDIKLFASKAKKALLIYGDSAQQLYKQLRNNKTLSLEEIQILTNFPIEQLVFNHRLPKKIARLAQYISSYGDDLEGRCVNEGAEKPKILKYHSFDEQLDAIAQIIENRNYVDVGILLPTNNSVEYAYKYLRQQNLNVETKYSSKDDSNEMYNEQMNLDFNSDNPKIMTYHSAKGLQFEAVFLPECNESSVRDRNPLYVALTRSYQSLYIMYSGELSSFFKDIPSDLYETTLEKETELL
jgi:superfamily I DNA/RNA helicase